MWKKLRTPLFFLSVGLNIAFILVWFFYASPLSSFRRKNGWRVRKEWSTPQRDSQQRRDPRTWFYRSRIGVSDTQWQDIEPLLQSFHEQAYDVCVNREVLRNEVLDLIFSSGPAADIEDKIEETARLRQEEHYLAAQHFEKQREILTADQQNKLLNNLKKMSACWRHERFIDKNQRSGRSR